MAAVGAAALWGRPANAATSGRRPNVVFFVVDDMGWMDSNVYGSRYYETPNVDRLATMSMRFSQAYSAAPLCSATRASLMSGKYPGRLHVTGASGHVPAPTSPLLPERGAPFQKMLLPRCQGFLPLEEYTLAEALKDAGYRTGFVGKWHLGHDEKYWPEHQGFDLNVAGGRWPGPPSYFSPYHISRLPDGPDGEYIADRLTDEAIAFIEAEKDGPFFLNFWQYAVHAPYQGKDEYRAYFEQKKDPRGAQHNAVMGAMIKSMDESLGRVLDTLERLQLMDDTIIIFTSDNGGNMYDRTARDGTNLGAWAPEGRTPTNNAPLRGGKGSVYEGGIRVPAMVYWPKHPAPGAVSDELVCSIDYYPTLLDMLDLAPRPGQIFDGISIAPLLRGEHLAKRPLFGHFPHEVAAVPCNPASWVHEGDWKLIRFYETSELFPDRIELYDLGKDLGERENLAEAHPRVVRRLEGMLDRHLADTGALVPRPNPDYDPAALTELQGWRPNNQCSVASSAAGMVLRSLGGDPFLVQNEPPRISGKLMVEFRMRSESGGAAQFFWTTPKASQFGRGQRIEFTPEHDGAWHDYALPFEANGPLEAIRLDPASAPGKMDVAWIRVLPADGQETGKEWRFGEK